MALRLKTLLSFKHQVQEAIAFPPLYREFHAILQRNNQILDLMAEMGDKLGGEYVFDRKYVFDSAAKLEKLIGEQLNDFNTLTGRRNRELARSFEEIRQTIKAGLQGQHHLLEGSAVMALHTLGEEAAELAGEKMAGLAQLRNRLLLPVPDGFVITDRAFVEFMERNGLLKLASRMLPYSRADDTKLLEISAEMQRRIKGASLTRRMVREFYTQFDDLAKRTNLPNLRVSLRSSAWEENGSTSFAGQYTTLLNVSRNDLIDGYLQVVASAYEPDTWRYRLEKGYREHEIIMAVGCQVMVEGSVSGVLHTLAPHSDSDAMLINACWGLCEPVVQGTQAADMYIVSREPPHDEIYRELACKTERMVLGSGGGVVIEHTPPDLTDIPCLDERQIGALVQTALRIEQYFKRPQEIEWTIDEYGNLEILQTRNLQFRGRRFDPGKRIEHTLRQAETIFSNKGYPAQCGIGVGRVWIAEDNDDLASFPQGGILVSHYASPRYAAIMHKARGIITDVGSPTGHMATLAREYRIPTIVNSEVATSLLHEDEEVTLDATQSTVYRGFLYALNRFELTEEEVFEDTYEYRLLRRLGKHVSRLNLVNSKADTFTPSACRTYHDIIRYIRAKAVRVFIRLSEEGKIKNTSVPKRLTAEIPLGLLVIDAGGGTEGAQSSTAVSTKQVASIPLRALLDGMLELGMWGTAPVSVNLGSFMSSFTRTFCTSLSSPQEIGRNLAVVLKNYMDINLRLGYHFTVMDSYLSEVTDDNYINFRFFGGVTEFIRRSRRAAFIAQVLENFDFLVEIHGDLVVARLKKLDLSQMLERMRMLGGLVGYTRQLDASMDSNHDIAYHADIFIKAINSTIVGG